jgi:hypothetical protein
LLVICAQRQDLRLERQSRQQRKMLFGAAPDEDER